MIQQGLIKFYVRYVDDTLLLVKQEHMDEILQKFNQFHKNLKFTVDNFENTVAHFLDLEIHPDGVSIYRKDTHTAQFVNYNSYTKFNHKDAWIRSLVIRAKRLCSPNKIKEEMKKIREFASYNAFPKWIVNTTMKKASQRKKLDDQDEEEFTSLSLSLPYIGNESEQIVKRSKKKLARLLIDKVRINVYFKSTKLCFFTSNKDRIPLLSNSFVIYEYTCPGCAEKYIGKTESTLQNRTREHAWSQKDSAVHQHFNSCNGWDHIKGLLSIDDEPIDIREMQISAVRDNIKVIGRADHWQTLAFKESLAIKDRKPSLNNGIKAAKDLCLF